MTFRIRHILFAFISGCILLSCAQERLTPDIPKDSEEKVTSIVHYRATAGEAIWTKASLNNLNQYIFETGDQLYVVSGDDLYGVLNLVAGAGDPTGTFEGDLMCLNGFEPGDNTPLSATLVSRNDKIHSCEDGKIIATDYEGADPIFATNFAQAVNYFSDFTSVSTYGAHAFSLEQNSTFLILSITFNDTEAGIINGAPTITATISNNSEGEVLRSGEVIVEDVDFSYQANFVAAFPKNTSLANAAVSFATTGGTDISSDNDIATSGSITLQANRYYEIFRSHVDLSLFTIQAKEDGTTVTFNFTGNGIQYKKVGDADWTSYDSVSGISLDEREYVQFRGKKNSYNTDGTPVFTADKACFIYGDFMSLSCDSNYVPKSAVSGNYAYRYAFKNATWIDIPSGRPLRLSATTLTTGCYNQMFQGCTSLTRAPELPALTIPNSAYSNMFNGCTALVSAPDMPATSVGESGYQSMFYGCTSLIAVPAVIAGTSGAKACQYMFQNCSSLANAPALPSTTVGTLGYYRMFRGCTSLIQAPDLPAETIGSQCYQEMFWGCTSLISAPSELPAETLTSQCYQDMFNGCLALSKAPTELPATTGPASCYYNMFNGCISLNTAPTIKLESIGSSSCRQMFFGCTSLVTSNGLENATSIEEYGCYQMYKNCGELTTTPSVLQPTSLPQHAYEEMYSGCAKITTAPEIMAESVSAFSCNQMFYNCRRLRTAPSELAVEIVAQGAFQRMFDSCNALVSTPVFTGMREVGEDGCRSMFIGCTNLTTVPELPATTLGIRAYYCMFQNSGVTSAPLLPAMTLASQCYQSMFNGCKYLEGPVVLPAPTLVDQCYKNMFNGASKLNSVVCLATDHSVDGCTSEWLKGVSSSGTFVHPEGVVWATSNVSAIPPGWTAQESGIDPIFPDDGPFNPEEDF